MTKPQRLQKIIKGLKTQGLAEDKYDKEMSFVVWLVEKEFNVGPVTEDFLALKLLNLVDEDNCNRYNRMMKSDKSTTKHDTFR